MAVAAGVVAGLARPPARPAEADIFERFMNALRASRMAEVEALFNQLVARDAGFDINQVGRSNHTPLTAVARWAVVSHNGPEPVDFLLAHGVDIDKADGKGYTPLTAAILIPQPAHQAEAVRYLLARGADVNQVDGRYDTPLTATISANERVRRAVLQELLNRPDIKPNLLIRSRGDEREKTVLMRAIEREDLQFIRDLLAHEKFANSPDIDAPDLGEAPSAPSADDEAPKPKRPPGERALIFAIEKAADKERYNPQIIQELLACPGVNPNAMRADGLTALGVAVVDRNAELVSLLLRSERADPNVAYRMGAPLIASVKLGQPEIVREFLKCDRTDPNLLDPVSGDTALIACCRNDEENSNQVEILRALLDDPRVDILKKRGSRTESYRKEMSVSVVAVENERNRDAFVKMLLEGLEVRLAIISSKEVTSNNEVQEMKEIGEALGVFRLNAARLDEAAVGRLVEVEEIFNKLSPEIKARFERAAETQQEPQTEDEPRGPRP
ncbi:MAG: ankyrin repeat protein [uncultured bacterium]|nr:MAG: ankyrin repeat protein [uncultured bacterium]